MIDVLIVLIGSITFASLVDKFLKHRREMEKIRVAKAPPIEGNQDLRSQLADWRQTSSEFDLSLESSQQVLARRLESLERRLDQVEQQNRN
jgi:tRNA A37 methylthiotransferase MiaB